MTRSSSAPVAGVAAALRACTPAQSDVVLRRAVGASSADIAAATGYPEASIGPLLVAGRRALLDALGDPAVAPACDRHAPLLSVVADGEAAPEDYLRLRPHLRACTGCRCTLLALYRLQAPLRAFVQAPRPAQRRRLPAVPAGLVAAAAVVAVAIGVVLTGTPPPLPDAGAAAVRRGGAGTAGTPAPAPAAPPRTSARQRAPRVSARERALATTARRPTLEPQARPSRPRQVTRRPHAGATRPRATPVPAAPRLPRARTPAPVSAATPAPAPARTGTPPAAPAPASGASGAADAAQEEFGFEG